MEGDGQIQKYDELKTISIHSLRMEGDETAHVHQFRNDISIHSLRMEGDRIPAAVKLQLITFQSTPSVWRETGIAKAINSTEKNFNPLPPYGGRLRT